MKSTKHIHTNAVSRKAKQYAVFIPLTALLIACGSTKEEVPKEYIQFDTMVDMMADIHVIEAKANLARVKGLEEGKQLLFDNYEQVFFNHGIAQKRFEDSYKYYSVHPQLFDALFEKTLEELNKRSASIQK